MTETAAEIREVAGGVCAAPGFRAAGVAAGIKEASDLDVALIVADETAAVAAVFTRNHVFAAPVTVSRDHYADGRARAIAVSAGNANCCTGQQGLSDAQRMAQIAGELIGAPSHEILVASTGVIGRMLPMEKVEAGLRDAAGQLSATGSDAAARAIMTTDTRSKQYAVEFEIDGKTVRIGGICKGSGMIEPNMGTMLAFLTTDAEVTPFLLQSCLGAVVDRTFNCVTVDGDTSTNDSVFLLANGRSGAHIPAGSPELELFERALEQLCGWLARELVRDGEGATKLVTVRVTGARDEDDARRIAKTIANSPLVKTACFGNDPNWGRVLMAAGRAGVPFDQRRLKLWLTGVAVVEAGELVPFDEAATSKAMDAPEIAIVLDVGIGEAEAIVWTCDFSYDYVRINAEYTT